MAVKNFVFRENCVDSKVAGMMKTTVFPIFGPTWTHILAHQKAQIRNSLNNILVKKDRNYITINFVTLILTNDDKIFENNQFFVIFDPNQSKIC